MSRKYIIQEFNTERDNVAFSCWTVFPVYCSSLCQ